MCLGLAGCALTHLPSLAQKSSVSQASAAFGDANECIAESLDATVVGGDVIAFANDLGPCVNVFLLNKSDQELAETFTPSGSGTYVASAQDDGDNAMLTLITVGIGGATAGAWSEHFTSIVCWTVQVDFSTKKIGQPDDADCKPELAKFWGNPQGFLTIADLQGG